MIENTHFLSFIVNLVAWAILGVIIGSISLQGHRRAENKTLFIATMSTLFGGILAFATHGTWVNVGVDFFNLAVALLFGIGTVYTFVPERREAISELFVRVGNLLKSGVPQEREVSELGQNFWNSIASTLVPR